jgi:pilus assembly protein CpaB
MSSDPADADNQPNPAQQVLVVEPCPNLGGSVRNRSNLLVLIGIAFFVVGGIIVYVVSNGDDDDGGSTAVGQTTVVVATHDIPANAKASEEIENGGLKEKKVSVGAVVPGAVQTLQQLRGATFVQAFADGDQILGTGVLALNRQYEVPEGFEAIAVSLNFPQGVAGYVNPGDRVNLYGSFKALNPQTGQTVVNGEMAKLLMTNVRVLDVSKTIPTNGVTSDPNVPTSRGGDGSIVMLLAVRSADAERIVFMEEGQALYATLVREDAAPAGPTDGATAQNILTLDPATSAG